jgi:hypothetical protein
MADIKTTSTRRAFFLSGGAVLGAGVATTVAASAFAPMQTASDATLAEDREAIRKLHLAFLALIEEQRYQSAAALFDENAHLNMGGVSAGGRAAILQTLADQYGQQKAAAIHTAYRQNISQQPDVITVSESRLQAAATFHVEVEVCTPLQVDCTAAQMARLQGHVAERRWESGRFEANYVKAPENRRAQWQIASLQYLSTFGQGTL